MNRGKSHSAAADISKLATLVNNIIFCCGCHMNCADRLFVRPAARPRNAGNRNGEMRGCNVKVFCAMARTTGSLTAPCCCNKLASTPNTSRLARFE